MKKFFSLAISLLFISVLYAQNSPISTTNRIRIRYGHLQYRPIDTWLPITDSAAVADTSKFIAMDSTGIQNNYFPKWNSTSHKLVFSNTLNSPVINTPTGIVKGDVGLGNVDNTSDATKNSATATLLGKTIDAASNTITGIVDANIALGAAIADSKIASAATWNANLAFDPVQLTYTALGSTIKAETVGFNLVRSNTTNASLPDGTIRWVAVYLTKGATLTGVKVYMTVQGNYTGDNNNKVVLCTYSGGTMTPVASSTNNLNVWKGTANTIVSIPFSSTYVATAGLYYVGLLYNQSAQVTAPAIAQAAALGDAGQSSMDFTNSGKFYGSLASQTDVPSSPFAISTITAGTLPYWVAIY